MDGTKGDICQGLNADVLIDDNLKHLVHAAECGVEGLLWFGSYPWQTDEVVERGVKRCADWDEVLQEINRIART